MNHHSTDPGPVDSGAAPSADRTACHPTAFDPDAGLHVPAIDAELPERRRVQHELGLSRLAHGDIDPEFDAFAADLARAAGLPYAMVNLICDRQVFAGLYADPSAPPVGRTMPRAYGYCPDVVQRRRPLVLPDVCAYPRFQSNAVVDLVGIRTYAGAPLIHEGTVLGTVCAVGTTPHERATAHHYLALIKQRRDALMELIHQRLTPHRVPR